MPNDSLTQSPSYRPWMIREPMLGSSYPRYKCNITVKETSLSLFSSCQFPNLQIVAAGGPRIRSHLCTVTGIICEPTSLIDGLFYDQGHSPKHFLCAYLSSTSFQVSIDHTQLSEIQTITSSNTMNVAEAAQNYAGEGILHPLQYKMSSLTHGQPSPPVLVPLPRSARPTYSPPLASALQVSRLAQQQQVCKRPSMEHRFPREACLLHYRARV